MRQALAKKLFAGSVTAITALVFGLMPAAPAFAQFHPTMKVTSGDLSAGGWFGSTCNQAGNPYQDAAYTGGGISDHSAGGIYTYTGTSSDYAAFALGVADITTSAPNGFNSSAAFSPSGKRLSFANIDYLGSGNAGNWDGGVANVAQCIPDYFNDKKPASLSPAGLPVASTVTGTQYYSGTDNGGTSAVPLLAADTLVKADSNTIVLVDGNVYINHNIAYDTGNYNVTSIPKFALVAAGNIYVDPSVTRLDGLYIAQPNGAKNPFNNSATVGAKTGEFWTCHGQDVNQTIDSPFLNTCQQPLTVNGSVIAKRVNLMRVNSSNTAREVFNYTPEMVIGGSFFPDSQTNSGSASGQPVFNRIISLPPVF